MTHCRPLAVLRKARCLPVSLYATMEGCKFFPLARKIAE